MAKKLLKESTIRRFQKLANVAPINEMYYKRDDLYEEEDQEMDDAEMGAEDAEMGVEDAEMGGDEEGMGGDLELTDEEAQSIIDLGAKLEAAMGGMGGMEDEEEMGMEDEEEMGEEELMEALRGISYVPSKGEVVNEVAKRVARRLKEAKLHEAKLNRALGSRRR